MAVRSCLFCGGKPLTKEHVLPRWLERVLPLPPEPNFQTYRGQEVRQMHGLDIQLRAVCGPCNHGWLHDLEAAFRAVALPALTGHAMEPGRGISLDQGAQQVIAVWAVKTWSLLEIVLKQLRRGAVETQIPRYLRQHNAPPVSVQVFVAAIASPPATAGTATLVIRRPDGTVDAVVNHLVIGHLVMFVYLANPRPDAPRLQPSKRLTRSLTQIWPNERAEVHWPAPAVLTLAGLESIVPVGPVQWYEIPWFLPVP